MQPQAADIEGKPRRNRGKTQPKLCLQTLDDLDGRTKAAQRALRMRDAILGDLGGEENLSELAKAQARHAAMDATILEDMHTKWLAGQPVAITEMVTVENAFNRTAERLGIDRRARDITPTLEQVIADARREASEEEE